jgi:hypothetical protein
MLGLFNRRPPPDPEATLRLKCWAGDLMALSNGDHVAVAELACHEPGCPDLETVVTMTFKDRRKFVLRFPSSVAGVTEAQVRSRASQLPGR